MLLTTDDVVTRFRNEVDDIVRGVGADAESAVLWTTDEIYAYMQEAINQTASGTLGLFKTFTIPYLATDGPYIALPSAYELFDISEVSTVAGRITLQPFNAADGGACFADYDNVFANSGGWDNATGRPRKYSRDFRPGYLRLYPAPTEDDTLTITANIGAVDTYPGMPLPFTNPKDVRLVLMWMKHLAYGKKDVDTFDPVRSSAEEAAFDKHVVERKYECQRLRKAPSPARFAW